MPQSTTQLKLWYAGSVGSLGAFPFLAMILSDTGMTPKEVASFLVLFPICTLIASPLWALFADLSGKSLFVLRLSTLLQFIGFVIIYISSDSPTAIVTAIGLLAVGRAPMGPLSDAMTLSALGDDKSNYGAVRSWGSVTFLIVVIINGYLREEWASSPLISGACLTGFTASLAWFLPAPKRLAGSPQMKGLLLLVKKPLMPILIIVVILHGITLTTYDNLFGFHVEQIGFKSSYVGLALGLGVAVEIGILAKGKVLLSHFHPLTLMLFGVLTGIPRWWLTASPLSSTVLVLVQSLHGIGFGAFWIGGVDLFAKLAPPNFERTAQAILPTATFGIGCVISLLLAATLLEDGDAASLFPVIKTPELFKLMAGVSLISGLGMLFVWTNQNKLLD